MPKTNHPHRCPDWDYMKITPGDLEFENCLCECGEDCFMYIMWRQLGQ